MSPPPKVAYFSMEIALDPSIPTYNGGLGMLAGDTLRSAADMRVPMAGVHARASQRLHFQCRFHRFWTASAINTAGIAKKAAR
jgi:glucan phosphorylase